jgi:hypothetical protein
VRGPASHEPTRPKTINDIRIGDWATRGYFLKAKCPNCGADRQVDPVFVHTFFGQEHHWNEGTDNDRIGKRLRCGTCGHRGATVRVVTDR